jgi:hypothetical protein
MVYSGFSCDLICFPYIYSQVVCEMGFFRYSLNIMEYNFMSKCPPRTKILLK